MTTIENLDDRSLLQIYDELSLQDVWTSGRVCVRLNGARRNCANVKRELALMVGKDVKRYVDDSVFQIPERRLLVDENDNAMFPVNDQNDFQLQIYSFPLDFVRLLLANFTNLTTLTISTRVNDSKEIDSIIHLLEQFNQTNGTLNTLKLYSGCDQTNRNTTELNTTNQANQNIRTNLRLLSAVNSIGSLRKLTFDVNVKFVRNANYPRIDLPILANLEEFEFNSADDEFRCLFDSITRYAVNNQRLRRIGIHLPTDDFTWLLSLPTELSSRFTHLHFRLHFDNSPRFKNLCRHFSNLTSLEINVEDVLHMTISRFRALTHLPNLLSLALNVDGFFTIPVYGRQILHFELPSVKVFTISIVGSPFSHNFFYNFNLNRLFPNIQVVRATRGHSLCRDCDVRIVRAHSDEAVIAFEQNCARYMFRHFAHCQHLRMVSSNVVGAEVKGPRLREWAWNEIGPFED